MKINVRPNQLLIYLPQQLMRLIGLLFILIGGSMAWFTMQSYELQCQCHPEEPSNQCQFITKQIFFSSKTTLLNNLQKAKLTTHQTSKGNFTYNVALLTSNQQVYLSSINTSSYTHSQEAVNQINAFLQQCKNQSLHLASLHPLWLQLFLLIFPTVGLLMLLLTKTVLLNFNKTANQLKILRKNLLNQSEEHYSLNKIHDIVIQQSTTSKGQPCYRVALILDDNTEVPLTDVYDSQLNPKLKIAKAINDFLGLNLKFESWVKKEHQQKRLAMILFFIALSIILFIILGFFW
ncbi:hypothetical protein [Legionella nagasakiensis]|uniref:hypothetical protein n=1 Tax=Legionella nagasakiensis TaxID=535290 RepID=UPI0010552FB5|nr:hypothetical protein [Legionella nagasakiensis]